MDFTFITVRNEVAKVMFLQASVCPQGGRWGCLPQCMLGYHTHPPPRSRHPPEQMPPQEQTPPREDTPPRAVTPPEADTPPRDTATAADGTHPTGMHSCLNKFWLLLNPSVVDYQV